MSEEKTEVISTLQHKIEKLEAEKLELQNAIEKAWVFVGTGNISLSERLEWVIYLLRPLIHEEHHDELADKVTEALAILLGRDDRFQADTIPLTIFRLEGLAELLDKDQVRQAQWFCEQDRVGLRDAITYLKALKIDTQRAAQ